MYVAAWINPKTIKLSEMNQLHLYGSIDKKYLEQAIKRDRK